jgi:hypothetical protein
MEKTPGNTEAPHAPHKNADDDFEEVRQNMAASMSQDDSERKARIEYLRSLTGAKPKKSRWWIKLLKILAVIIVVAALAGGVFWYFDKKANNDNNQPVVHNTSKDADSGASQQAAIKHYDYAPLGLGFDYPESWKVTEASGKIVVASPATKLKTFTGTANAQIVFTIQSKQTSLPGFKSGNGLATRASEKVAYTKPTQNQRAQTYMTFVSNAGSATSGIDAIFITGDLGYQKDQAVPQADIVQGDPLVSFFFAKCEGTTCAADPTTARITIADSAWADNNSIVKAAKTMFTSLTIQ